MSKMIFNYDEISKINIKIDLIIKELDKIQNQIYNADIPLFKYYSFLKGLGDDFRNKSTEINYLFDQISRANKIIDEYIEYYNLQAKKLPNYIIDKRDSIIKI